ncbi:MAG: molybdenum cofactor guanylyltransferase [Planctomycetota bacterium]|nr:molybdenum cofactor guanylyltransferase [Planctomycetota bacterium]
MNAAVLAGGKGRRAGHRSKPLIQISDGLRLIDLIIARLKESCCFEKILVVGEPTLITSGAEVFADCEEFAGCGVLGGLLSALVISDKDWNFVCGCDMPFIEPQLIRFLKERVDDGYDVVFPQWGGYAEPLFAFYNRRVIEAGRRLIFDRNYSLTSLIKAVRSLPVEEALLRGADEELLSFFNINTDADIKRAREIWAGRSTPLDGD